MKPTDLAVSLAQADCGVEPVYGGPLDAAAVGPLVAAYMRGQNPRQHALEDGRWSVMRFSKL